MLNREWKKSSRSASQGNCVEARTHERSVQVRDSKLGDASPIFSLDADDFASLLRETKHR